jgi:hypothetical protein
MKDLKMMKNNPWISIKKLGKGIDSERIDPSNKFDFFWALGKNGEYTFIIEHDNIEDWSSKKITLFGIDIQQFQTSKGYRLALVLNETSDWDIFYILCNDLLQATSEVENQKTMLSIIYNRLQRWQKLFRKFGKKLLSEQEQQGLIGELYFLKHHLLSAFSSNESLSFWKGPFGEQQDFGIGDTTVEVKSKQGTSAPYIQISSIDQLECNLKNCFLYVVTLNIAPHNINEAFSLNTIIEEIKLLLSDSNDLDVFENLLSEVGYIDLPEYSEKQYLISKESIYEITDGFPRLRTEDIPNGITSIQYKIELKECSPFEILLTDLEKRMMHD